MTQKCIINMLHYAVFKGRFFMLESLKNLPFTIDKLPAQAQKAANPDAPLPLKMMAAKGALPVPPDALIYVWYQLSFAPEDEVKAAVKETVCTFDNDLMADQATKDLPECILDWLAKTTDCPAVLEKLVLNPKTHDATVMDLAATAPKEIIEIISNNHVRLLRSPEIIEKIYYNPNTRMATVDKLLALAKEHNIEIPNLKNVQDAAEEIVDDKPGLSEEEFEQIPKESNAQAIAEKPEGVENLNNIESIDDMEEKQSEPEQQKRLSRTQLIDKMNAPQRIRLALVGSREDRSILIRDTRRVVYMNVIKSPKISIGEVSSIATSKSMPDEIIQYITTRRDWIRYYPIVVSLVNNPKCPLASSMTFLKQLRVNDLKMLTKSKSVPAALTRTAVSMLRNKK